MGQGVTVGGSVATTMGQSVDAPVGIEAGVKVGFSDVPGAVDVAMLPGVTVVLAAGSGVAATAVAVGWGVAVGCAVAVGQNVAVGKDVAVGRGVAVGVGKMRTQGALPASVKPCPSTGINSQL